MFRLLTVRCPRHVAWRGLATVGNEVKMEKLGGDHSGVTTLTLARPSRKNALGKSLIIELREHLRQLKIDNESRVVILKSECEGVFCAGADLKERATMTQSETADFVNQLRSSFLELEDLPMPTIAIVNGAALGGGLELAMSCDFRIGSNTSKIGLPETSLAIIPGAGGTQRLVRLIGKSKAKELVFTARRVKPEEALSIGLLDRLASSEEDAEKEALNLANQILPNGPVAVRMAKVAINKAEEVDLKTGMTIEQLCYAQVIPTKDRVEGLTAFKEKRKPVYKGE